MPEVLVLGVAALLLGWLFWARSVVSVLFVFLFVQLVQGLGFMFMGYGFLGLVQWLLYGGALAVLFVFARLLYPEPEKPSGLSLAQIWLLRAGCLTLAMVVWLVCKPLAPEISGLGVAVEKAGTLLMSTYLIPLELISVFLLAALVIALWLARTPTQVPEREHAGSLTPGAIPGTKKPLKQK